MKVLDQAQTGPAPAPDRSKRPSIVGITYVVGGAAAILLPARIPLNGALTVAGMLTTWGGLGLWLAFEMRPAKECAYAGTAFALLVLIGLGCLLFPSLDMQALTIVMMIAFVVEGIVSVLLALRLSGNRHNWGWMAFSGLCSLIIGLIILIDWPETAIWTLGMLLGINFLSTGLSLIMMDVSPDVRS